MSSIDPNHQQKQEGLRTLGGVLAVVGGILTAVGMISFFSAFGGHGMPQYFWCAFIGLPMFGTGMNLLRYGYLGTATRYVAGEVAPVVKDTIEYITEDARKPAGLTCQICGAANPDDARYCSSCGGDLHQVRRCGACGEENEPGARFCHHCGQPLE
jgi:hypothetical protein